MSEDLTVVALLNEIKFLVDSDNNSYIEYDARYTHVFQRNVTFENLKKVNSLNIDNNKLFRTSTQRTQTYVARSSKICGSDTPHCSRHSFINLFVVGIFS